MMKKLNIWQLNLIVLLLAVVLTFVSKQFFLPNLQNWLYGGAFFFFLLNILIYYIFSKNNKRVTASVNNMMISSILRMFLSIAFILSYLLLTSKIDKASVIFFLFYYLLFMAFEIYYLVYNLRPRKPEGINT